MAMTTAQQTDAYRFFSIAFNAAPGVTYMNQLADAYEAGMTTKEIVNVFTTKEQFTSKYPTFLTTEAFATSLINNVVGASATDEAKTAAAADVVAAINSGYSRGDVIFQIFSNLAAKAADDAEWGATATMMANKVAVAKYVTETQMVNTTDLSVLAKTLSTVTATTVVATAADLAAAAAAGAGNEASSSNVLTTTQDIIVGGAGADTFRGVAGVAVGGQDQTTLNSSDILDGGDGADTLVVNMTGPTYNGGARLKSIETLQIGTNQAAAMFDYNVNQGVNEVTDVKTIVADQINTGEALTIRNLVRDTAATALPTISWVNDSTAINGLAGTVNVGYRAASVSGAADEQAVSLTGVRAGTLNIAAGDETIKLTSAGAVTNSIAAIDSVTAGTSTLKSVFITADAQLGGARVVSTTAGTIGMEIDQAPTNANTQHVSHVLVGSGVTLVDATGSKAAVKVGFTDATAVNNTFIGGDGDDEVLVNGGNDNLSGGKGADTFLFDQTNTSANGTFFNNSDTIDGGEGKDTILINYAKDSVTAAPTRVTLQTSEWLNSKGVDALDLRALNTVTQLDDAFVGRADVGSFEIITNKIIQNDSVTSAADEANSRHLIDLTTVSAQRNVKVTGGEGRETVVVTDALNGTSTLSGGNGLDTLVVQNSSTLTGQDLANVSGFNVINLVKTSANAQSFNIDLSAAFLTGAVDTNVNAGVSKNVANAFRVITDAGYSSTTGANGLTGVNGVQVIAAGDTVNITVDTTGLTTVDAVNLRDLIASGATINVRNTAGTVLLAATGGAVTTAGTGIFAGVVGANNVAYDNLAVDAIAGVGTPLASGQASVDGAGAAATGNTLTLTAANAVLTNAINLNATPAATFLTAQADTVNVLSSALLAGSTIIDSTAGDSDVLNATLNAAAVAATISGIETLNLSSFGGGMNFATVTGNTATNVSGTSFTATGVAAAQTISLNAVSGAQSFTTAAATATDAITFNLAGTVAGAALTTADSGAGAIETVNLNVTAASTLAVTSLTAASTVNVTGAANLALTNNHSLAGNVFNAATFTGALTFVDGTTTAIAQAVTGGLGNDTFTFAGANGATANLTTVDTINGGAGTDTINAVATAAAAFDNVTNVETVVLTGAASAITTVQGFVTAGNTVTINAAAATGGLTFNGTAETDGGRFSVTGSSTIANALTGGFSVDTLVGGAGNDTITGGVGADIINVGTGTDRIVISAIGQTTSLAAASQATITNGTTSLSSSADVITGLGAADIIDLSALTANAFSGAIVTANQATITDNTGDIGLVRGNFNAVTGIFTASLTGADSAVVYDANGTTAGGNVEAIILVGFTGTATTTNDGVITLA